MRGNSLFRFALVLMVVAGFSALCFAQTAEDGAISNAEVVKMIHAGLPESVIVREIRMSRTPLAATPAALIQLKKSGASEAILNAVLDSQGGPAVPDAYASASAYGEHRPHLPSFEADLRVKSNKHERVSVGQNHISVQQSGQPLFSLTWRDTAPKQ
jgi:hypothetical protein